MKDSPIEPEKLHSYLLHRFKYHITFIVSFITYGIILSSIYIGSLFYSDVDKDTEEIGSIIIITLAATFLISTLITLFQYYFDQQRKKSTIKKPLNRLVEDGFKVVDGNVIGQHKGYPFNISKVSYIKKLSRGAFVVHIYFEAGQNLTKLRKKYCSDKTSELNKIHFHRSHLQFYFIKVLYSDSYTMLIKELDRVTSILADNNIKSLELENVELKLIPNSDFRDVMTHILEHTHS